MDPAPVITCIDCGGRCHLLTRPAEDGWEDGEVLVYRCEDCLDRWDLVHEDEEEGERPPDGA